MADLTLAPLTEKYYKATKRMFEALHAKTLTVADVRPSEVLGAYTRRKEFFNGEEKKGKLPDAFIFEYVKNRQQ